MKFMRTNIRKRSGTVRKNTASGKSPQAARKGLLVRSHVPLYLFALCFLAGMVLGVVMSLRTGEETLQRFDFLFHTSAAIRLEEPVSSIFAASFASSFLFLLVCFLCGLSVWGFLFVPAVVFFRGYGVGLTAGFLCAAYQWKGAFDGYFAGGFFDRPCTALCGQRGGAGFEKPKGREYGLQTVCGAVRGNPVACLWGGDSGCCHLRLLFWFFLVRIEGILEKRGFV